MNKFLKMDMKHQLFEFYFIQLGIDLFDDWLKSTYFFPIIW